MPVVPTDPAKACKIISHQGGGIYVVEVLYDDTPRTDRMAEIDKLLIDPKFQAELAQLLADYQAARQIWLDWITTTNNYIVDVNNAHIAGDQAAIKAAEKALREVVTEGLKARDAQIRSRGIYNRALAEKTALETERLALFRASSGVNPLPEVWCMDLADGQAGRAIYQDGSFAPLVCLNYDTNKYLLPPKNNVPELHGGGGGPYEIKPLGVFNRMDKYRPHDAGAFKFWNVALEPGFAKWKPILMRGIVVGTDIKSCAGVTRFHNLRVRVPFGEKGRFGHELAFGEFSLSPIYFSGGGAFNAGDEVVCAVTVTPTEEMQDVLLGTVNNNQYYEKKLVKVNKLSGYVIGFVDNPKTAPPRSNNNCAGINDVFVLFTISSGTPAMENHVGIFEGNNTKTLSATIIYDSITNCENTIVNSWVAEEVSSGGMAVLQDAGLPWIWNSLGCEVPFRFYGGRSIRREDYTLRNSPGHWYLNYTQEQSYFVIGDIYIPLNFYDFTQVQEAGQGENNKFIRHYTQRQCVGLYYANLGTGAYKYREVEDQYWTDNTGLTWTRRIIQKNIVVDCTAEYLETIILDQTTTGNVNQVANDPGKDREVGASFSEPDQFCCSETFWGKSNFCDADFSGPMEFFEVTSSTSQTFSVPKNPLS